ncbi:MAG: hypothetical protein ABI234_14345 [Ktedonobacteraceae bacterium]
MSKEPTFLDHFTREGHLKTQLLQIAANSNPTSRIAKLRLFYQQLGENLAKFPQLCVLLFNTFLQADSLQLLTESDLKAFEELGTLLLQTSADSNTTGTIWNHLADIYSLRGDLQNAGRLFARIYYSPLFDKCWRSRTIQELAKRKLLSDEYICMYIDYVQWVLEPTQETEVLAILTIYCSVNFATALIHIKKSAELIKQLLTCNIILPCTYTTLGLYHLLIEKNAINATRCFEKAYKTDIYNELALIGLLAAWIQNSSYKSIDYLLFSQVTPLFNKPLVRACVQFSTLLQWLESRTINSSPPLTTKDMQQFTRLDLQQYVGDMFHTAYARLHLFEGNAREALTLLQSYIHQHPEQLRWHYYAAWAEMQLGEKEALLKRYCALIGERETFLKDDSRLKIWPGRWIIACLLLDTDPSIAEEPHLEADLHTIAKISPKYVASIIETRLALVSAKYPFSFSWKPGDGSLEEDLEALRTGLGYALYVRKSTMMKQYMLYPLFQHLPLADQKMWTGVMLLTTNDGESTKEQTPGNGAMLSPTYATASVDSIEQGCKSLEEVALQYGYHRAALILAVHYMEQGSLGQAKTMLQRFMTITRRTDAKIQLLNLYIAHLERSTAVDIGKSVRQPELAARAYYTQGCLYLSEARYDRAINAFDTALAIPHTALSEDCYALTQCAQFLAHPDIYSDIWPDIKQLNVREQKPFLLWYTFLARLWYAPPADIVTLWQNIGFLFDNLDGLADETRIAIAQMITRACQRATSQTQAEAFMHMLAQITRTSSHSMLKQLQNKCIALSAYKQYLIEDNHTHTYDYLDHQLQVHPSNCFLVILLALTYLEQHDTQAAMYVLDKTSFPDSLPEQELCRFLAALLKGQTKDLVHIPPLLNEAIQRNKQHILLVDMLLFFAAGDSVEICTLIFSAWKDHQAKILNVINLPSFLSYLCVHGANTKALLPQLVDLVQQEAGKSMNKNQQVMLARCFVIIGQIEQADKIWQALSRDTTLSDELLRESAVLLCHMAVQANNNGDKHTAILRVREAAKRVNKKTQQENLERIAHKLELQIVTQEVLTKQFPGIEEVLEIPGRYHGVQRVLEGHTDFQTRFSKLNTQPENVWNDLVYEYRQDVQFLHMLAILYQEYVQAHLAKHDHQKAYLTVHTILWTLLLCTDDFWHSFSQARIINNTEGRENLSNAQQEELFEKTITNMLFSHLTHARRAFNEARYNDAEIHLRCLYRCSQGVAKLQKTLQKYNLRFEIPLNTERLQKVITNASDMLNQWCTHLLKEAEEALGNIATLQKSGKNYEAGLHKLKHFIDMHIPLKQVLLTNIHWHNDWCGSSYRQIHNNAASSKLLFTTVNAASRIVDQLILLSRKGYGFLPENRAIAQHFVWRGLTSDSQEAALHCYQTALQWDASNVNAQTFIKKLSEETGGKDTEEEDDDDDEEGEEEEEDRYNVYDDYDDTF